MMFHARLFLVLVFLLDPSPAADIRPLMKHAEEFGKKAPALLVRNEVRPYWADGDSSLIYQVNSSPDETEFIRVDLVTGRKSPAFDRESLAKALAKAADRKVDPKKLPINQLEINGEEGPLRFRAFGNSWRYSPEDGAVSPDERPPKSVDLVSPEIASLGSRETGADVALTIENGTTEELELFWVNRGGERKSYGKLAVGEISIQQTYAGHAWLFVAPGDRPLAGVIAPATPSLAHITERVPHEKRGRDTRSPDGVWRAAIKNHNLVLFPKDGGEPVALTRDGTAEHRYTPPFRWSPDSRRLVAFREKQVSQRKVHIVQSSPKDQLQPKLKSLNYTKPGDDISQPMPRLFDVENRLEIPVDDALFENPWNISELTWADDSSEFSFLYNQRGHQLLRLIGVRSDSGSVRVILEETSETFIDYSQKTFLHHVAGSREILWASERSGYNHLYLLDRHSGKVINTITQGAWNVREVVEVDDTSRQLLLKVVGVTGQDPYHEHFIRVGFDGSGFTRITVADGNHRIDFSPDRKFLIDTWSRVDQPPVVELRRAADGTLVAELERADDSALRATGWSRPERFTAKGRDGKTDIHGIIIRPTDFDPSRTYPVVEDIYAGPHDHFVPKSYFPWSRKNDMAELGFIIVNIDGMGTNWRSREFHDICWKNLKDGGFPDRIPWIKAAAADRPWMDLSRVGIFGGSAGGQNALAGLLHHGDFYKVGVADCGCHDNRMDKIWWNEAWMGWPVDESYVESSNVTHADKLTGKLLLIVGELDTNVDPASTAQVVSALQQADKEFEYMPIMNAGHGAAETPYGKRLRAEFLVRHLLGE